ncbi:hypothetical protein BJ165DRAFT_1346802 [Panaeolus papilionaceus]|nr:hypothetical protein BJ165DRAFT_1346802 [Panaeolus papilionaceus]
MQTCSSCSNNHVARWRCRDCIPSYAQCRSCIRQHHLHNPLHHIECWTGTHFRHAALWEVGVYIVVPHHDCKRNARPEQSDDEDEQPDIAAAFDRTEPDVRQPPTLMRIVHTNGFHRVRVLTCRCHGSDMEVQDLVACHLMPTSFDSIRTLFTTHILDFARLANLELYASAYQVNELLCRLTQSLGWTMTDSLYHELRRMLRIHRWMKKLKWASFCHSGHPLKPAAGQFTIFCPACPQPGINLPDNWETDADNYIYARSFVADGNFKAKHLAHASGGMDAALYDGAGVMPNYEEYHAHISSVVEQKTVTPCDNTFRAIESAMLASKVCDITGVVAVACARHGFYAPNALTDLVRGEQQKNVDYAFVKALALSNVHQKQKVTIMYDIACQYFIHLRTRIDPMLAKHQLEGLSIDRAIGLFHVHAHNDKCYFQYSPTFIPGLGRTVGEILESNWFRMNKGSKTFRSATKPARAEGLDDHASNNNFRKMMNMAETLTRYYVEALQAYWEHKQIFEEVSQTGKEHVQKWTEQIEHVEANRVKDPTLMDIYGADTIKAGIDLPADAQTDPSNLPPLDRYISFALMIEEKQIVLRTLVSQTGSNPTEPQTTHIEKERQNLITLLSKLRELEGAIHIVNPTAQGGSVFPSKSTIGVSASEHPPSTHFPEHTILFFPSNGNMHSSAAPVELKFRCRQAHTYLNQVRDLVVEKSLQYSHVIRGQSSSKILTRARGKVQDLGQQLDMRSRLYQNTRAKFEVLKADDHILAVYQPLTAADTEASTILISPNARGSTKVAEKLSWIWRARVMARAPTDKVVEVIRVHWLCARALYFRWHEEYNIVLTEMASTVRYFLHCHRYWSDASILGNISPAAAAYASRKADAYLRLATQADFSFCSVSTTYKSPM